jgi:putative restriction endonuclease
MLRGYVATTDFDWYSYLRTRRDLDEVNFWQPSGSRQFRAIRPGEPLFFKLKSPQNRIAGFGVFLRSEILPDWLAWECFGQQNGTATESEFRSRLAAYRRKNGVVGVGAERVTCLIISTPVFFRPDEWVEEPRDWKKNIVSGKGFDLSDGEGRRVFEECRARAQSMVVEGELPASQERVGTVLERYGEGVLVQPRLGQGSFRLAVEDAYGKACAVTREHSRPVLEAAHIKPYGRGGEHAVSNGILLRRDLHRLFDCGYVTVEKDSTFRVSERLKREYNNGKVYYALQGTSLNQPKRAEDRPDATLLAWHRDVVFRS